LQSAGLFNGAPVCEHHGNKPCLSCSYYKNQIKKINTLMARKVIEKRSLRYDFSASELHDKAQQLAKKNKEVQTLKDEKKSVVSQLKARIDGAEADVNLLSNQVAEGWEYRDVECEVVYHQPQQGKKTIIRTDNNRKTAVEAMADHEWDLFNQPGEDENLHDKNEETVDTEVEVVGGPLLIGNGVDEHPE
jgi:hypothetical protein